MKLSIKIPPKINVYLRKLKPLAKHHYFIVTVVLFSAVAFATYTVNETLNASTDENYKNEQMRKTIGNKFNQTTKDTIEKIKSLQKSTDASSGNAPLPEGRINPFAE